jgi:hypothetical protein
MAPTGQLAAEARARGHVGILQHGPPVAAGLDLRRPRVHMDQGGWVPFITGWIHDRGFGLRGGCTAGSCTYGPRWVVPFITGWIHDRGFGLRGGCTAGSCT